MIDITKHYVTLEDSRPVTLISDHGRGTLKILGYIDDSESVASWDSDGRHRYHSCFNLIEVRPYADYRIGEPVIVDVSRRYHFAGVSETGEPMVFSFGLSAWAAGHDPTKKFAVKSIRKPTATELQEYVGVSHE